MLRLQWPEKWDKESGIVELSQELMRLLSAPEYVPLRLEEIAERLQLKGAEARKLRHLVSEWVRRGKIAQVKAERYCLPRDADLVTGTIRFRQSGSAVVIPETAPGEAPGETLVVRAEDTGVALHGDRVLVRLVHKNRPRRHRREERPEEQQARVVEVLDRVNKTLTGTLQHARLIWYVVPDDPRIVQDILVPDPSKSLAFPPPREGDKVVVQLLEWKQRHLNPVGEIQEVLGKSHTPFAEYKAILHKYHLSPDFPDDVLKEVSDLPDEVRPKDSKGREDCRELFTFTIDPDDAKDFDDALSLEVLPTGEVRVGIHIADVGYYVKPGTALDREARERGNSTYLVGTVIPMLPHALSNGLCSLVEAKDRLTKSVFLTFAADGQITKTRFANTVIRSAKRLTYRQAYALLKKETLEEIRATPTPPAHQTGLTGRALAELSDAELKNLQQAVRTLWNFALRMRTARMAKGSLDLDAPEVKIFVDKEGYADRIETIENDESHQLIEEYMLAANEAVARAFHEANLPFISRVHDEPDPEKLKELREYLILFGIQTGDLTNRKEVVKLLQKLQEHPQAYALRIQFLRSLKQACYRASTDGHYGLAKTYYAHFTSPIRRYSDLVVHRIFDFYASKHRNVAGAPARPPQAYKKDELEQVSEHLSMTERNSAEAERDSVKVKLLEYFEREVDREPKSHFGAIITEVRNHGIFIELAESFAFGMVPMSSLQDDLYFLTDDGTALVGRRTKRRFQVGEKVEVVIRRVDRFKRQMDFDIVKEVGVVPGRIQPTRRPDAPQKKGRGTEGPFYKGVREHKHKPGKEGRKGRRR